MKKILAVLAFLVLFGTVSPAIAYSQSTNGDAGKGNAPVPWDGTSQLKIGKIYALRDCDPNDPYAPCYVELFENIEQQATEASDVTVELQCGVNVKNSFGTLVAKLWETANVTWEWNWVWEIYEVNVNWKVKGIWTLNGNYQWVNLVGPTQSSPQPHVTKLKTTGDLKYLGLPWRSYSVSMFLYDDENPPDFNCASP